MAYLSHSDRLLKAVKIVEYSVEEIAISANEYPVVVEWYLIVKNFRSNYTKLEIEDIKLGRKLKLHYVILE